MAFRTSPLDAMLWVGRIQTGLGERKQGMTGIGSITFADPKFVIPLQIADMIAYELFRFSAKNPQGGDVERPVLKNLEKSEGRVTISLMTHDRQSLEGLMP
jgi:hypothetical protein